jgi:hypothetical protein
LSDLVDAERQVSASKELTRIAPALLLCVGDENEFRQTEADDALRAGSPGGREEDCRPRTTEDEEG